MRTRLTAVPGLVAHGRVETLYPWLDGCLAALAPLRFGAGVKGKINTAMSHGLPVIATPLAIEGMHLIPGHDVLLAEDADGIVAATLKLTHDGALWQRLAQHGRGNVRRYSRRSFPSSWPFRSCVLPFFRPFAERSITGRPT